MDYCLIRPKTSQKLKWQSTAVDQVSVQQEGDAQLTGYKLLPLSHMSAINNTELDTNIRPILNDHTLDKDVGAQ